MLPTNMPDPKETHTCIHCLQEAPGAFCSHCGEPISGTELTVKKMWRQWTQARRHDLGIFFLTLQDMLLRPGKVIQSYWDGPRGKYYQPFNFYMLVVSIIAFFTLTFSPEIDPEEIIRRNNEMMGIGQTEQGQLTEGQRKSQEWQINYTTWIQKHFNLAIMATLPFFAFAVFLLMRKQGFSYGQQLIFAFYVSGTAALLALPMYFFVNPFDNSDPTKLIALVFSTGYYAWCFRDLHKISWLNSIIKGVLVFIIYFFTFIAGILVIAIFIVLLLLGLIFLQKSLGFELIPIG